MRTDPSAEEVRDIVERVFEKFLLKNGPKRREKAHCGPVASGGGEGRFPRLYEPQDEAPSPFPLPPSAFPEETILIDQGRYVARSYRTPGYLAMWLVPAGIVQFYDDQGRMLATINLFESLRPQRMVA